MTGSIFKRKLRTGVSWGYVFFGGWDENGKRIQMFKSGFPTKDAASRAVRVAIEHYEAKHGKVSRELDSHGRRVWAISFGDANPGSRRSPKPNPPFKGPSRAAMLRKRSRPMMQLRVPGLCSLSISGIG